MEELSKLIETVDFNKTTTFSILEKMQDIGSKTLQVESVRVLPEQKELRKNHTFFDVQTFLDYIRKYKTPHSTIYSNLSENKLYCVLDESSLKGGGEVIYCNFEGQKLLKEIQLAEGIVDAEVFLNFIKERRRKFNNFMELYSLMSSVKISTSIEKVDREG